MNIEEGPFETFDIVEVAMNNDKVAMIKDNNEFRKMIKNTANKENIILQKDKINMQLLSTMSMKTKDDLKISHIKKKSFTKKLNQTGKLPCSI